MGQVCRSHEHVATYVGTRYAEDDHLTRSTCTAECTSDSDSNSNSLIKIVVVAGICAPNSFDSHEGENDRGF